MCYTEIILYTIIAYSLISIQCVPIFKIFKTKPKKLFNGIKQQKYNRAEYIILISIRQEKIDVRGLKFICNRF